MYLAISIFDFAILYMNISHHKLKSVMEELVNPCVKGRYKKNHWERSILLLTIIPSSTTIWINS